MLNRHVIQRDLRVAAHDFDNVRRGRSRRIANTCAGDGHLVLLTLYPRVGLRGCIIRHVVREAGISNGNVTIANVQHVTGRRAASCFLCPLC